MTDQIIEVAKQVSTGARADIPREFFIDQLEKRATESKQAGETDDNCRWSVPIESELEGKAGRAHEGSPFRLWQCLCRAGGAGCKTDRG